MIFQNKKIEDKTILPLCLVLLSIVMIGIYFCIDNKYGWDFDTYAMINSFFNIIENNFYQRSRGSGYLVPEIGIGFLSYYFGSITANLFTFSLLIFGLMFFYLSYDTKSIKIKECLFFLTLCLSNYVVIRDGTIPMDYAWSFFFFSLGFYFFSRGKNELSIIFFSLCLGSRIHYILFIIPIIFLYEIQNINIEKKITTLIAIMFIGGLFYVPTWLSEGFSLKFIYSSEWFNHFRPDPIFSKISMGKFFYKILLTFGIFNSLFLLLFFFKLRKKNLKKFNLYISLIAMNLILYFIFPWQQAHLWIFIFSMNYLLINLFNQKIIIFFIFLNLFTWFYQVHLIDVKYQKHLCYNELIGYEISPNVKPGFIYERSERKKFSNCFPAKEHTSIIKFKNKIKNGKKIYQTK